MARNVEKAKAMLNRWYAMKRNIGKNIEEERPRIALEVNTVYECEKWRNQVVEEISDNITEIMNAGLGEHKIREINDYINKLIREKSHWEERIRQLGGADYKKESLRFYDAAGVELPGSGGYKYFGAAKDLPGVRELFQRTVPNAPRQQKRDLYKNIGYKYYKNTSSQMENQLILQEENECEEKFTQSILEEHAVMNGQMELFQTIGTEEYINMIQQQNPTQIITSNQQSQLQYDYYQKAEQNMEISKIQQLSELETRKQQLIQKYVADDQDQYDDKEDDEQQQNQFQNDDIRNKVEEIILQNKEDN